MFSAQILNLGFFGFSVFMGFRNKMNKTIFLGIKFCIDYSGYKPFYDVRFRSYREKAQTGTCVRGGFIKVCNHYNRCRKLRRERWFYSFCSRTFLKPIKAEKPNNPKFRI
eukprot:sb/3477267/